MQGREKAQAQLFGMTPPESRIPADHPLGKIRKICDEAMSSLNSAWETQYSSVGQPVVPPQILLRALLLQALYSIKSERALCEQIEMNILFRWFVGLDWDDAVFDHSVLSKNRLRLLADGAAQAFLGEVVRLAQRRHLLQSDRLVVDGTLIKACASMKSFKADDGSDDDKPNFKGTKRSNKTHTSMTDPDARLFRKGPGQESMLCHMGHILVDGLSGIVRACRVTPASGKAEVEAALSMLDEQGKWGETAVADRFYDQTAFVGGCRELGLRAHPRAKKAGSRLDGRTTNRESYKASMKTRHIVERAFGWIQGPGRMRQTVFRGTEKVDIQFTMYCIAHNLRRLATS
jgi:transposase